MEEVEESDEEAGAWADIRSRFNRLGFFPLTAFALATAGDCV